MARPRRRDQVLPPVDDGVERCDVVDLVSIREARRSMPTGDALLGMADLFAVLGDPTRLRIVSALDGREMCVCDIATSLGLSTSATSHQLRALRDQQVVRTRREGRRVFYSLDDEHVQTLYRQALDHVAHQEAST